MPSLPLRRLSSLSAAVANLSCRRPAAAWTPAPISLVAPASADHSLYHISVDLSSATDLAAAHTAAGQYVHLRLPSAISPNRPVFLAIASPPPHSSTAAADQFDFLVKRVPGTSSELLCGLRAGNVVELGPVMGRGFEIDRILPPSAVSTVLMFATGSGISPIRSLIESDFNAKMRADMKLYYGARNLQRMAYQDRFRDWESIGVRTVTVLSRPDGKWTGLRGYVQTSFLSSKQIVNPSTTGAVLCGQKQMAEEITSVLVAEGVPKDQILMNF